MSGDLVSIEQELVRLSNSLSGVIDEFEALCRIAAEARNDYDVAWAKALLKISTDNPKETVAVKDAMATTIVEGQMREARIAEAIRDAAKERIRALESMLTVHQSRLRWLDEGRRIG